MGGGKQPHQAQSCAWLQLFVKPLFKFIFVVLLIFTLFLPQFPFSLITTVQASTANWYDTNWKYRKKITIDHTKVSADLTDFPLYFYTQDTDILNKSKSDRSDILFTASNGTTKLSHEIEQNNNTIVKYQSSWPELTQYLQGVATDGTYVYVSAQGSVNPGTLLKYSKTGVLQTSRALSNLTDHVTHIGSLHYKDGFLYVADAVVAQEPQNANGGRIVRFKADDLTYDSVVLDEAVATYYTEGSTFYDNSWWLCFWSRSTTSTGNIKVRKYDSSWSFIKEYSVPNSSGDCQGLDFFEQNGSVYLVTTVHDHHAYESGYLYINKYNQSDDSFSLVTKIAPENGHFHPQGFMFENRTNGAVVWFADRVNNLISKEDLSNVVSGTSTTSDKIDAYVKIPALSSISNTEFYIYYGNSSSENQTSPALVWDNNFKGVWHLNNDPTVSNISDSTSNKNNGSIGIATTSGNLVLGKLGKAMTFSPEDVGNNYVEIPDTISLKPNYITVSTWIRADNMRTVDQMAFVSKAEAGGYLLGAWYPNATNLYFVARVSGTYYNASADKSLVTDGAWHKLDGTYDGQNFKIYVDGALKNTTAKNGVIDYGVLQNIGVRIGAEAGIIAKYFNGYQDETRISDSARSSDWISTEYNNENSPTTFFSIGSEIGNIGISATLNNDPSGQSSGKIRISGNANTGNSSYSVSDVQYSVNGGSWNGATATDGGFNTSNEDFYFDFKETDNNYKDDGYTVRVKAQSSSGIWQDNLFYFQPFNLDSPSDNLFTTNTLPTFSFSVNKGRFSDLKDNLSKFQVLVNKDNKGWQTYIDSIPVDFESVKNNADNLQKTILSTNGNGIYENKRILVNYSNNNSSISVYSKAVDSLGNSSDKYFEDGGHKLDSGSYLWKVVSVDKAGHSQETQTRKLRVNTKQFQASQKVFPLIVESITGLGKVNLSTISPQDVKDEYFTSSFTPTVKGIAYAGTTITLTIEDNTCLNQMGIDCLKTYTTTTGLDSRYMITFPRNSLRYGRLYILTLSVKDSGDNYNELPTFKLRINSPVSESIKGVQTTESQTPTPELNTGQKPFDATQDKSVQDRQK
ncbi:MAG: LamG domain-containing protein, partial [Patescibacteria group bacterium]|nr:LamG domain-containing protein [Patescibacteria group bacterium]